MTASPARPFQFNELLHALREAELYKFPKRRVVLSAGCAGAWYFDWMRKTCDPVRHVGVELYSPKPESLPPGSEWIVSSISAFPQVPDRSIDIVFSGQNIEHLWPDDIVGFLLESRRVLRDDGFIAIDTPNRTVTSPMNWTHLEHTAEFTVDELTRMLALAGFEVDTCTGHWLCKDLASDRDLPLVPDDDRATEWVVAERISLATVHPERAFSVWLNARVAGTPDPRALEAYVIAVWGAANTERLRRTTVAPDCIVDGDHFRTDGRQGGFVLWGPYIPLRAGRYRIKWRLRLDSRANGPIARVDVANNFGTAPLAEKTIDAEGLQAGGWSDVSVDLSLSETTFGLEFRLASAASHPFSARRYVEIERLA